MSDHMFPKIRAGHRRVPVWMSAGRAILTRQTVLENLMLGAFTRRDRGAVKSDLDQILERFPRLAERRSLS